MSHQHEQLTLVFEPPRPPAGVIINPPCLQDDSNYYCEDRAHPPGLRNAGEDQARGHHAAMLALRQVITSGFHPITLRQLTVGQIKVLQADLERNTSLYEATLGELAGVFGPETADGLRFVLEGNGAEEAGGSEGRAEELKEPPAEALKRIIVQEKGLMCELKASGKLDQGAYDAHPYMYRSRKRPITAHSPRLLDEMALTDVFAAGTEFTLPLNGLVKDVPPKPKTPRTRRQMAAHIYSIALSREDVRACVSTNPRDNAALGLRAILEAVVHEFPTDLHDATQIAEYCSMVKFNFEGFLLMIARRIDEELRPMLNPDAKPRQGKPQARSREQLIEGFATMIARMPDMEELIRTASREDALVSLSDQAGELLAALVEDDRPEPHRVDEFNTSWKDAGGTARFTAEIAVLAYEQGARRASLKKSTVDEL